MHPEDRKRIGQRVASARRRAGMTQRELADALGVTTRSIQHYEAGAVIPYKHMRRLELLTRTRPGWILAETDESRESVALEHVWEVLERHRQLMIRHLEEMQRHTERLREFRELAELRRNERRDDQSAD
jgi:transcriptional regulator with XRE-family HTH domain